MGEVEHSYRSRKFIVTMVGMAVATIMAYVGKLTPELSNVLLACIAAYNLANAWHHGKSS